MAREGHWGIKRVAVNFREKALLRFMRITIVCTFGYTNARKLKFTVPIPKVSFLAGST